MSNSVADTESQETSAFINRLFTSDSKWLLGVCSGIASYFRIDPAIVRVVTLILTLCFTVLGISIYLVVWLIFFRDKD